LAGRIGEYYSYAYIGSVSLGLLIPAVLIGVSRFKLNRFIVWYGVFLILAVVEITYDNFAYKLYLHGYKSALLSSANAAKWETISSGIIYPPDLSTNNAKPNLEPINATLLPDFAKNVFPYITPAGYIIQNNAEAASKHSLILLLQLDGGSTMFLMINCPDELEKLPGQLISQSQHSVSEITCEEDFSPNVKLVGLYTHAVPHFQSIY
jgi:hypothetical protein